MNFRQNSRNSISTFTAVLRGSFTAAEGHGMLSSTVRVDGNNSAQVSGERQLGCNFIPAKGSNLLFPGLIDFDPLLVPRTKRLRYICLITGAEFSVEVQYLEDVHRQNLIEWRNRFIEARVICDWPEEHSVDYVLALTSSRLHPIIKNRSSADCMWRGLQLQ